MNFIYVLVQSFGLYLITIVADDCSRLPECHVFDWKEWGSCTGVCGSQSQLRKRNMCCSTSVQPHNIENCLKHCNRPSNFKMNESKSCRICENSGTRNISSQSCECDQHYKDTCCQDLVTCPDHPCKRGNCIDTDGTFTCGCDQGYTGPVCDSTTTKPSIASSYKSLGMILGFTVLGVICAVTAVVIIVSCLCCPQICFCTKRDEHEEKKGV